jgi:hypothetical protein
MPNLPEGYFWSEYIRTDDAFWNGIRASLIGFFAIGPTLAPSFLGTGFVVGTCSEGFLLVLTAKHVVIWGALEIQKPLSRRAPSAPSVLFEPTLPSIDPKHLRAVWMGTDSSDILLVRHISLANNLDFALCIVEHQSHYLESNGCSAVSIALDTRFPQVGEWINIVALTDFTFDGAALKENGHGPFLVGTRPVVRVGKILSREDGAVGHNGPCFRTSVPVDKGMNGGFAYVPRDGQTVAACGIVSSGPEDDHKQSSFLVCGNSACGGILGAVGLKLPAEICGGVEMKLLDLLRLGDISDVSGADIDIVDARDDGSYRILWRA